MKTAVSFQHINNWGTFSNADFMIKSVANPNHPEHQMFQWQVAKVKGMREEYPNLQIFTNF
jgi:hypothetical protein